VAIGDLGKWGVEPTTYKTTYIYIYIWVIKTWVKKPWVIKTMGCKAQIEDMGSKDNGFQ
jgi:hypothetical protein